MFEKRLGVPDVEEYYFDDYYRVVVVKDGQDYVVSVDVYKNSWAYDVYESICVENTCLFVKRLSGDSTRCVSGVREVMITGVKVGSKVETINVKWILDHKPSFQEVGALYECSWRLITYYDQP